MSFEDKAQEHELALWERNNQPRTPRQVLPPEHPGYGPETCDRCDGDIPEGRRALGYQICVGCAAAEERRSARFR